MKKLVFLSYIVSCKCLIQSRDDANFYVTKVIWILFIYKQLLKSLISTNNMKHILYITKSMSFWNIYKTSFLSSVYFYIVHNYVDDMSCYVSNFTNFVFCTKFYKLLWNVLNFSVSKSTCYHLFWLLYTLIMETID